MSIFNPLWLPPAPAVSHRRRGGRIQRLAAEDAERANLPPLRPSRVVLHHLLQYASGSCAAVGLWRHIEALVEDDLTNPAIMALYSLASKPGDQNTQHNLQTYLLKTLGFEKYITRVFYSSFTHAILPSSISKLIHQYKPAQWLRSFGADRVKVLACWNGLFSSDAGRKC